MLHVVSADFATPSDGARKRRFDAMSAHGLRSPFARDRDRIIHSRAFRRLGAKTQVFTSPEDHYRTRLTHSVEVAQVARSLASALRVDSDLAEAIALAHDLGHSPFGHAGEDALNAVMAPYGGFDHNLQTLRVVLFLEHRYAGHDGLNLCPESIEGLVMHNGPPPHAFVAAVNALPNLPSVVLEGRPTLEAAIAAVSDDIAYLCHDLEDGLSSELITLDEIMPLGLVSEAVEAVLSHYRDPGAKRLSYEISRRLLDYLITDLHAETQSRLKALSPQSVQDIIVADHAIVQFSDDMLVRMRELRVFLQTHLYRHEAVRAGAEEGAMIVTELFSAYEADPGLMPTHWRTRFERQGHRAIADYIAGMTDRYAARCRNQLQGNR